MVKVKTTITVTYENFPDEDNEIVHIAVDRDYVVSSYPKDINERLKQFIGVKIKYE